jgi:hypothetical protein
MKARIFLSLCLALAVVRAEAPKFRTDANGPFKPGAKNSDTPDWYQLVEGQFPPDGSAHAISGELMLVDHLDRRFQIRVDRNDSQDRGVWDLPLDATMLPYGTIRYLGAPAALQDIPLGTHLHGLFYLKDPNDKTPLLPGPHNHRYTPEKDFRRCFQLEDDFTLHARQQQLWKIESVDLQTKKLTATLQANGKPIGQPATFDLLTSTRVMQGDAFTDLNALQAGQMVLFNLTWVTLYGPGRITDIWLDEPSRARATAHQLERHRNYIRERGLPGWVTAVEDESQIVTVTFFGGVDPKLFDDLSKINAEAVALQLSKGNTNPFAALGALAVAGDTLMTYDPVNDRKRGSILEIRKVPVEPGGSGVQIKLKMEMMLEGYRPNRVVRYYPATWKVIALPKEEGLFGRE